MRPRIWDSGLTAVLEVNPAGCISILHPHPHLWPSRFCLLPTLDHWAVISHSTTSRSSEPEASARGKDWSPGLIQPLPPAHLPSQLLTGPLWFMVQDGNHSTVNHLIHPSLSSSALASPLAWLRPFCSYPPVPLSPPHSPELDLWLGSFQHGVWSRTGHLQTQTPP